MKKYWNEIKNEWNNEARNPFWLKSLIIFAFSYSIIATLIVAITN
tara:strand:- start:1476 stop:1610 length:135 start_codon:yes stop_codon:yes gene_type:complete